jgi:hypothetical protein
MAEIKSESVADFIPESVAGLLRNQHRKQRGKGEAHDSVAVVGSIIRRTSVTLLAGKPLSRACSWMIASSLAR